MPTPAQTCLLCAPSQSHPSIPSARRSDRACAPSPCIARLFSLFVPPAEWPFIPLTHTHTHTQRPCESGGPERAGTRPLPHRAHAGRAGHELRGQEAGVALPHNPPFLAEGVDWHYVIACACHTWVCVCALGCSCASSPLTLLSWIKRHILYSLKVLCVWEVSSCHSLQGARWGLWGLCATSPTHRLRLR